MSERGQSALQPGDYLVVYGTSRLELIRLRDDGGGTLIRATFEAVAASGPRFEREAVAAAALNGVGAYRVVPGAQPVPL